MSRKMSGSARLLRLLDLLQARKYWTGRELAESLGIEVRTVRRDIDKLRGLGYSLEATRGADGGYFLESGTGLPPLLLTDDEAVAVAVGVGVAASVASVSGMEELAVSALAKLEQVLPKHLRRRVSALRTETTSPTPKDLAQVDPTTLAVLALACRDSEVLHVHYSAASGDKTRRYIEPMQLVHRARRWYLVCWDRSRSDWRTLRADRVTQITQTSTRFAPRPLPLENARTMVDRQLQPPLPDRVVTVIIDASYEAVAEYLGGYARDIQKHEDKTQWRISEPRLEAIVAALVWLPWSFSINGDPEVEEFLRRTAQRFAVAASFEAP